MFTYPASCNKESLTLRSIHFLLEDGNTEYLVTNLMPEQIAKENFQIYTSFVGELKANIENLRTGLK